jgi:hypothetical protein
MNKGQMQYMNGELQAQNAKLNQKIEELQAEIKRKDGALEKIRVDAKWAVSRRCGGWLYYEKILGYIAALAPVDTEVK